MMVWRPQGNVERNVADAPGSAQCEQTIRECGIKLQGKIEMFLTERLTRAVTELADSNCRAF